MNSMHPLKSKILDYCLSLPHTEETFPFDTRTWVAKVYDKMFALMDILDDDVKINLKCNPEKAEELRAEFVDTRSISMKMRLESTIRNKVVDLGIIQSEQPPQVIKVTSKK